MKRSQKKPPAREEQPPLRGMCIGIPDQEKGEQAGVRFIEVVLRELAREAALEDSQNEPAA